MINHSKPVLMDKAILNSQTGSASGRFNHSFPIIAVLIGAVLILSTIFMPAGYSKQKERTSEDALMDGLIWLARHQNPDGSWGANSFAKQCKGTACSGTGEGEYDIGVTGLALLAFTGAGYTSSSKDEYEGISFGGVVKKAANYLISIQDNQGVYGGIKSGKFMYNQAIAAYAMADLYGLVKDSPSGLMFKDTAQKGIDYLISAKNPGKTAVSPANRGKGWRYQPRDRQNDSSVTGWAAMALKSAELAELDINPAVFADIKSFYDDVTDPKSGQVGYTELGSVAIMANEINPKIHPSMTAIGITVRMLIDKKKTDPVIKNGIDLILRDLPAWDTAQLGVIDYYYWFQGSNCLNRYDGPDGPCWKKWNEKLKEALVKNQRLKADKCACGSWDPIDRWSEEGGRVYATAINVLTLETYYIGITRSGK
ncbi:MAG: prenyltransferase/squalene oxidase repeat-containing protein [Planctomycetota bacterium]